MPKTSATLEMGQGISRVAALDIGSNSFHLVVARIVANDVQILHQLKLRVQLADGLSEDGVLSEEAIARGLENLEHIVESLKDLKPDQVRVVATYTLRKARNARDFIRAARKILPYPIEIISGAEEARLIYLGVAHTSHHEGKRLVVDIGGGSTEIIIGEGMEPLRMRSLSIGCVVFTNLYFKGGRIRSKSFSKAITHARQEIETRGQDLLRAEWTACLGSSGTIRAIMDIVGTQDAETTPRYLTLRALQSLVKKCVKAGDVEALEFSELSEERRRVLPAGLAILTAIFESLHIKSMEYSPAALREGVIYDMEERLSHHDIRARTVESLAARYVVDMKHARRVEATVLALYQQVKASWDIEREDLQRFLAWAALLHEVGLHINAKSMRRHSAYILQNAEMPGFNREEQDLLATIVRFQRKRIQKSEANEFLDYAPAEVTRLIALLRLGILLNFQRQDKVLPAMRLEAEDDTLRLVFPDNWLDGRPIFRSNLEREHESVTALGLSLIVAD
ncbi:MAG: exopolyphosphatase [Pseudomonadales bacterium]|nr:exopolyphosphatase [Pseudomonadales bacterium]